MAKERTCFNCEHDRLCFIRHAFDDATSVGLAFFNIDGEAAPAGYTEIYAAVANACMEYKEREDK